MGLILVILANEVGQFSHLGLPSCLWPPQEDLGLWWNWVPPFPHPQNHHLGCFPLRSSPWQQSVGLPWLVAQLDCYLTEKYAVFFPTGLAKQVAEVESSLIILAIFDSSRLCFEPNLALLHALHITISVLTNSN